MVNLYDVMSIDLVRRKVMEFSYPTQSQIEEYRRQHLKKIREMMILPVICKFPLCMWCRMIKNMNEMQEMTSEQRLNRRQNISSLYTTKLPAYYKRLRAKYLENDKHMCANGDKLVVIYE